MRVAAALTLAAYLACLIGLGRGVEHEDWDGIKSVNNALLVAGISATGMGFDVQRAPLGWLAMLPVAAPAYAAGGPRAALRALRWYMPLWTCLLVGVCWSLASRRGPPLAAALAAAGLALNPMLIQFSPFALLDTFAALPFLWFLAAAYRYVRAPSNRSLGLLGAAYLAAFLAKYHLGAMILIPLAWPLADPETRGGASKARRALISRLWILPPACWLSAVALIGALIFSTTGGDAGSWRHAQAELWRDFAFNVLTLKASSPALYVLSLWRQLGPGLAALALIGLWSWLEEDDPLGRFLALSLLGFLLIASVGLSNREPRYLIPALPLVYAAVGQGFERLAAALPNDGSRRAILAAGVLLFWPWKEALAAARHLRREPSVRTAVPWRMAELAEAAVPPEGCVGWLEGDIHFQAREPLYRYEPYLILGAPTFRYFVRRRVKEIRAAGDDGTACSPAYLIAPRWGPQGERWAGPALARGYRLPAGVSPALWLGGVLDWEAYSEEVSKRGPASRQIR